MQHIIAEAEKGHFERRKFSLTMIPQPAWFTAAGMFGMQAVGSNELALLGFHIK
jgi:hypothetical protein